MRATDRPPGSGRRPAPKRPRDFGRPLPRKTWDRQYRDGAWESLDSLDEFAHYLVIAGYVHYLFPSPTVLDVGCGPGRLAKLLEALGCASYVGIDLSPEAVRRARRRAPTRARFQVADLNRWRPGGRFSVIVFCESLNYAIRPIATLRRYARALRPAGGIIVSLYRHPNHRRIWKQAERHFAILDSTTVTNGRRQTWDIKVLQPLRDGDPRC